MNKYIINLDLHGGDFAPQSVLEGALLAQTKNPLSSAKTFGLKSRTSGKSCFSIIIFNKRSPPFLIFQIPTDSKIKTLV